MKSKRFKTALLLILLGAWLAVAGYGYTQTRPTTSKEALTRVVIGFQKGDIVDISRQHQVLAQKMKAAGYQVVFKEFQDGAALMTALKSGNINYARLGDAPPVVNQATGLDLIYIGAGAAKEEGTGILVKKDSGIDTLAALKGKRIAYAKGTTAQYTIIQALAKAGLSLNDVKLVNMDQSASSVAFAKGSVDAWVTWDPFTATAQINQNAKLLTNAKGLAKDRDFVVSSRRYATKHRAISKALLKYMSQDMAWARTHPKQVISMQSKMLKLSKKIMRLTVERRTFAMTPVTTSIVKEQQQIADVFYEQGLIKKRIQVKDALLN
ncbi:aliphatic sulfonate ABC transporter substrate-binding protein [Lacticaseibacillus jixianensis]|uniref:Aliphatic sulfonate ABC transporter substrate-binding protein n=1 Tax=Lacticaseibacillus jixianensis TaxID=2486012 RepID=A0ABW4BAS6_9LACO|nr:aliphatic sulfonate ABC transporter substrate-binding protein [Lacticaseibacillus jixianensis]